MPMPSQSFVRSLVLAGTALAASGTAWAQSGVAPEPTEPEAQTDLNNPPAERPSLVHAATIQDVQYGVGARLRWISVPRWFLGLFTAENEPVSSLGVGLEVFRRRGDTDLVLGFGWQSMSAPDGNWLGKGKDPRIDTDFVQMPGLGLVSLDFAVIRHESFSQYVGMHFGAGLGLALVTGTIYRTSAGPFCNGDNAGDESKCYPAYNGIPATPVPKDKLGSTEGGTDSNVSPHRFVESSKPPVFPILNVTLGLDFRLPNVQGLEIRPIELGWFDAFFIGGGIAYVM
jgi:hypothetical protein